MIFFINKTMDYKGENYCPEEYEVCLTEEDYYDLLDTMSAAGIEWEASELGDAQAITDFTWQILFLTPWELAYIALPMSVLAFYGLSIYAAFKYLQKKFS
jgi:hypothetical protein